MAVASGDAVVSGTFDSHTPLDQPSEHAQPRMGRWLLSIFVSSGPGPALGQQVVQQYQSLLPWPTMSPQW